METKVVIVDDHKLFNDGLSLILKDSDAFDVIGQVYESRHAFQKCRELNPQLILVDYNMPGMDGLQVVKQLKTLASAPKIVIISMYADSSEIALFDQVGIHGYLTKVVAGNKLIEYLLQIMGGKKVIVKSIEEKVAYKRDYFALKHQLTKRELEILKAVKRGLSTEQIAEELHLSYYTIETHRKNVNQKLKFETKKQFYDFLEDLEVDNC